MAELSTLGPVIKAAYDNELSGDSSAVLAGDGTEIVTASLRTLVQTPWTGDIDCNGFGLNNFDYQKRTVTGSSGSLSNADRGRIVECTFTGGNVAISMGDSLGTGTYRVRDLATAGVVTLTGSSNFLLGNATTPSVSIKKFTNRAGVITIDIEANAGTAPKAEVYGDVDLPADMGGTAVYGYRGRLYRDVTGNPVMNAATFAAGSKILKTGAAATWTVPSRLSSADTDRYESLVVRNSGSGTITWSASGTTLIGTTSPLAVGATAVLEWDHSGTVETVEIRTT